MLVKIVIALLVAAAVISVLAVCSCCVVAGRADETISRMNEEENRHGKRN